MRTILDIPRRNDRVSAHSRWTYQVDPALAFTMGWNYWYNWVGPEMNQIPRMNLIKAVAHHYAR